MGAMETERALQALKQLFEGAIRGKPLAPARVETAKRLPKEAKKAEAPKPKGALKVEVKSEAPKDAEVVRKAIVQVGQEVGRPLTAAEKMTVFVSDKFRTTVGIENQRLLGGVSRLTREVDWQNPTTGEWEKARSIMGGMPKMSNLSEQDQMVLHEVRQAAFEHYYRNHDAIQAPGLSIEKVQEDPALKGASVERIQRDERQIYHGAKSGSPENTQAWAEDIEKQIIDDAKLPPETTITVTRDEANDATQNKIKVSKDFEWLVKDGEIIEDPQIAQVVHDIVSGDSNPTKEMLLVKGSQLKHGRGLDEGVQESPERQKFRQRLLKKVQESYGFSEDPRKPDSSATEVQRQLFETITHELFGFESGMPPRAARGRAGGGGARAEFGAPVISYMDRLIRTSRNPAEKLHAKNLKWMLEDYNQKVSSAGTAADKELEAYNLIDTIHHAEGKDSWFRFIAGQPDLRTKYEELRKISIKVSEERYAKRDLERGWSSLYVSIEDMTLSWKSVRSMLRKKQDEANMMDDISEGNITESIKRNEQQLTSYIVSDDYIRNRRLYLEDPKNQDEIFELSGHHIHNRVVRGKVVLDPDHPWCKEITSGRIEFLKSVKNELSATSTLQRLTAGINLDTEMSKMKSMYAEWGDVGYTRIVNQRNGINMATLQIFKEKGASVIYDEHGNIRALVGGDLKYLEDEVASQMWAQHQADPELYGKRFKEWEGSIAEDEFGKGIRRKLTPQDFKASAKEISYLFAVTGQRAQIFDKAATPFEMMHHMENPAEFTAQPAEGKIIFANSPFRWLVERWAVQSDFMRLLMRNMFHAEATRSGIDKLWEARLSQMEHMSPEFKWLVKRAFNISVDIDTPAQELANADKIEESLSVLNLKRSDSSRWKLLKEFVAGNQEGAHRDPPTKISEVTMDDLKEQILYREGMRLLDARFSGSYHIMDVNWNLTTQQDVLKKLGIFSEDNGVLLHESAKIKVAKLIDTAGDHKKTKDAKDYLKEKTFTLMAKFDPTSSLDALVLRKHKGAMEWYRANAGRFNIFHQVIRPIDGGPEIHEDAAVITADRPDLFIKAASMRRAMIDTELAGMRAIDPATGADISKNGPVDYFQWNGNSLNPGPDTDRQMEAIQKICHVTGVDVKEYMDAMKSVSEFAMRDYIRADLADPAYAIYFNTVRKIDSRVQFLDSHPDWRQRWSSRISSSPEGRGAGGGFARWAGDTENSREALQDHLVAMLEAKDTKTVLMHAKPFFDKILFSGGHGYKAAVAQSFYIGWGQTAVQDVIWDYMPTDMENSLIPTSPGQRAAGLGAPSIGRNDLDHFEHDMEMAVGQLFHTAMPDFSEKMDKKFGLAWNVNLPIIGHRRIPRVRLYNVAAFGLIAGGLLAIGAFAQGKKGAKEAFGGSAGGDEGHG